MTSVIVISEVVLIVVLLLSIYFYIRNNYVYSFLKECSNSAFNVAFNFLNSLQDDEELVKMKDEYEHIEAMIERITSKSYDKMLFSFKPIKLKYWYTQEEIDFIKEGGSNEQD